MKFVDEAVITVEAGKGGDGCMSFRREKYVPRGGPDGGGGGDGGSVFVVGSYHLETLADLEYRRTYRAERGRHGKGQDQHGKNGDSIIIPVPLGTDVWDAETGVLFGEVVKDGEKLTVAKGGDGGRGNARFKTATNVAPRTRELGQPGEKRRLRLVLRILADVGLVGLPNAGKSTLLSKITRARPRIGDYPFTTLSPNLGALRDDSAIIPGGVRYTVADLPGIVEDAHKGKGLGLQFLRHIERTRLLVFVVDLTADQPLKDYERLNEEIRLYNPEILKKRQIVVFNKLDLVKKRPAFKLDQPTVFVSALTGAGVSELETLLNQELKVC
jgi:GTP-binding protein